MNLDTLLFPVIAFLYLVGAWFVAMRFGTAGTSTRVAVKYTVIAAPFVALIVTAAFWK